MHYRSSQRPSTQQGPDRVASRRTGVSARLAAFFDALGRRPVVELPLRTLAASDPDRHRRIRDDADLRIIEVGLDAELRDARHAIGVWYRRVLEGDRSSPFGDVVVASPLQLSAEDRARILQGLDEALLAVILGDQLPAEEADDLLGGWSDLVPRRR